MGRRCSLFLVSLAGLYAQSDLATVTGLVTDPVHSPIPAVTITIRNVETNIARQMLTNEEGYFTITSLSPGHYELTAEKAGFRTYRETDVVLEVGQTLRSDVQLQLGAVTETISVKAEIAPLNTENGAIKGDVLVHEEIQDLPLNGRDFTDLAFLVPGVFPNAQGGAGSAMSINGARADNTNFYVDGFNDRNARGAAAQLRPNLDALQEFKMEVSGYSAEYGKMAGGILNMVLRSGTNQLHGSFFEYLRNDFFDARAFFDTSKLELRQNQFGGTLLGPLVLPKVYNGHDRTFFLFSWESFRQILGESRLGNVPSLTERGGDFSTSFGTSGQPVAVKDPLGSGLFPNNVIPTSRMDPIALKLLKYYPSPNRDNLHNNYVATANVMSDWDSFIGKLDHRFSSRDSIAFRYGKRFNRSTAPWAGSDLGTFGNRVRDDRSLLGLDHTHLFSPTLLIETRVGFSRNAQREKTLSAGQDIASELGIAGSTKDPLLAGFPRVTLLNYLPLGAAANEPVQFFVTDIQTGAKFTWIHSKHILKWGLDISRTQFNQPFFNNSRGTVAFQDRWTNHPVGDFLLGLVNNSSITAQITRNYLRFTSYGTFVNDDFKVSHSLTLNLGVRYEIDNPPVDKYDRMSNFIPGLNKIVISSDRNVPNFDQLVQQAKLTGLVGLASDYGFPRSLVYPRYKDVAPRAGFAWRPSGSQRMVLRGGYGIFYSGHLLNDVRLNLMTGFPFSINQNFSRLINNPNALMLANPFPQPLATLGGATGSNGYELHAPSGYLQSYNLTVEREVGRGAVVEVGYVGSKGTHLGRQYDINQPLRTLAAYQANSAFPRPIPELNTINYWGFGANSIYHAGQLTLRKRASGGFFYRLSYIYSKSIDNASQLSGASDGGFAGALDARNLRLERARSDWDRGHAFTASFTWQMPVGRGRTFLNGAGKLANALLGQWQLSGATFIATGQPFTVEASNVDTSVGEFIRPNRLGPGIQSDLPGHGRRGVDYPFFRLSDFEGVPRCDSRATCLASPHGFLPFSPGNTGRNILDGPGQAYINLGLLKNFALKERRRIQFRYEVFNVLNQPNFKLPNRFFNAPNGGIISGVQDSGRGGPRVMQLALRYEF